MYEVPGIDAPLFQGDIFRGNFAFAYLNRPTDELHILRDDSIVPASEVSDAWSEGTETILLPAYKKNLAIVLSNTCDISGEGDRLELVTLGAVLPMDEFRDRRNLPLCRRNRLTRFHHLTEHPESGLRESFVHFGLITLVLRDNLDRTREARIATLVSPFRESLGHRYGEFVGRVALPDR